MTENKKSFPMTVNPVSDLDICRHVCNLMRKRHVTFEDCAEHIGADADEFVDWLNGLGTIPRIWFRSPSSSACPSRRC